VSFAIVVAAKPVSVNSTSRPAQKKKATQAVLLQTEVQRRYPGLQRPKPPLYARIVWFHSN
jgi:hypothetical protein